MIYKNKEKLPNIKSIELNIKDFSKGLNLDDAENVCDMNYNVNCYNFDFKSGALVEGFGFENATVPANFNYGEEEVVLTKDNDYAYLETWHFKHYSVGQKLRCDKLMIRLSNNVIYYSRLFSKYVNYHTINDLQFTEKPFTTNVKIVSLDGTIMSSDAEGVITWNGEMSYAKWPDIPVLVDLCLHKDRMFAIIKGEQNFVRYSTDLEIINWTNELRDCDGIVELNDGRGSVQKIMSCFGYLFCLREYGITKLTTYENSNQINVSHVHSSGSKIFCKTACDCGDKIILLTRNGLYQFNGSSCNKINTKLNDLLAKIKTDNVFATYRAGVYYIACRIDFEDGKTIGCESQDNFQNNVLICYNVNENTYTITRGVDILNMNTLQAESCDKTFFCFNTVYQTSLGQINQNGKFFEDVTHKYWCSPLSDLGYSNKVKYIKTVSILSKYDCTLTIFTEKDRKSFKIKGSDVLTKLPVRIRGKQIGIEIETDSQKAYISNMKLNIDLIENKFS